ncbi:hypothetical protein FC789_07535 [Clostridium botulinum]|nr:hypothetical protein [Clostridium botulinum]
MAKMIPDLSEKQLKEIKSHAEVKVYKALKNKLSEEFVVLFQVCWIVKKQNDKARDGEADFVICHPIYGYLCIEIKGGGISFKPSTNQWYSVDRNDKKNKIKDPVEQVKQEKHSIRLKLNENLEWRNNGFSKVNYGHAVFFPDIDDSEAVSSADIPINLIGTFSNLCNIDKWIEECFRYWSNNNKFQVELSQRGIDIIKDIFAKSFNVRSLISVQLKDEEGERLELTNNQIKILDILKRKRRVVISGGAGTGKTILAIEKAKRLANEGFKTLLTCYNRPLADKLADICRDIEGLDVMNFHQLCDLRIKEANRKSGRDLLAEAKETYPGENEYEVQIPIALAYSTEIIEDKYEAIICDEGQDFKEEFWLPLELLIEDEINSPFYIFFDDNQNIYSRVSTFPISQDDIYSLTTNCRNTIQIHNVSYRYYKGDSVSPSEIDGKELQLEMADSMDNQAEKIKEIIVELINEEKVNPRNISILIANAKYKNDYFNIINKYFITNNIKLTENEQRKNNEVLTTTVNRFKGLESDIVFLWGLDYIDLNEYEQHIYVGSSRAKSILFIVGNAEVCSNFALVKS